LFCDGREVCAETPPSIMSKKEPQRHARLREQDERSTLNDENGTPLTVEPGSYYDDR